MANTIVIEKGNRQHQNVEMITPDTRVNFNAAKDVNGAVKYPVTDLNNGMSAQSWEEDTLDGESADPAIEFVNPHEYVDPDVDADADADAEADEGGSDEGGSEVSGS